MMHRLQARPMFWVGKRPAVILRKDPLAIEIFEFDHGCPIILKYWYPVNIYDRVSHS
jgi:hypothetical protein